MGDVADKPLRSQLVNIHKLIGLVILVLMLLRLIWAVNNIKPSLPAGTPTWQRWSERWMHFLLYAALIVMPVSGWVGSVAGGKSPHLGSINFSLPLAHSKSLSDFAFDDIHIPLAVIIIILVSIHALAAFYHHFVKKDDVLRRMLPRIKKD